MARRKAPKKSPRKKPSRKARKRRAIPVIIPSDSRAMARELGIPFEESEREVFVERTRVTYPAKPKGPPKAISVESVARAFDDPARAIDFARRNLIHPSEWADDLADEWDLDVHEVFQAYFETDPAKQAA